MGTFYNIYKCHFWLINLVQDRMKVLLCQIKWYYSYCWQQNVIRLESLSV